MIFVDGIGDLSDHQEHRIAATVTRKLDAVLQVLNRLGADGGIRIAEPFFPVVRAVHVVNPHARLVLGDECFTKVKAVGCKERNAVEAGILSDLEFVER